MDIETRLSALTQLLGSQTQAASDALIREHEQAIRTLDIEQDYEALVDALRVLKVIGYRFSARTVGAVGTFVASIETRSLMHSPQFVAVVRDVSRYRNASTLIVEAMEVLVQLRHFETVPVFRVLLRLSVHSSENVVKKAKEALGTLTEYDIDVIYGQDRNGGIGVGPQLKVIEELEGMQIDDLSMYFTPVVLILDELLSPTMESSTWSYNAVTLTQAAVPPADAIADIRSRSVRLLERLYRRATSKADKLRVIDSLSGATRAHHGTAPDQKAIALLTRDAKAVLSFFESLIPTEDLQIVQKVESTSYWIFARAETDEVKASALAVEQALASHIEYGIYRVLVGFEGIFRSWAEVQISGRQWEADEKARRLKALEFAKAISPANYADWRRRILSFARTESEDLATFPIFYYFLEMFARSSPDLGLRLVVEDTDRIARFVIPLLRGLWEGPRRDDVRALFQHWISEAQIDRSGNLYAAIKMFLSTEQVDIDILKQLCTRAIEVRDTRAVSEVVEVAFARSGVAGGRLRDELLLPAIRFMTSQRTAAWVFDMWYRSEARQVFETFDHDALSLILENLLYLPRIEYQAEEVLFLIAEREPEAVLEYFAKRIRNERESRTDEPRIEFEAIPYEFHKLHAPLSRVPGVAVTMVRVLFEADPSLFQFRGARLLHNIFPSPSEEFEKVLMEVVSQGSDPDLQFVISILSTYEGEDFVRRLSKHVVRALAPDSPLRMKVATALESTGVVSGEFGMAEAYERKRLEVLDWLEDSDEKVRDFAKWYIDDLVKMRDAERARAVEEIALRKFQYGEGAGDRS